MGISVYPNNNIAPNIERCRSNYSLASHTDDMHLPKEETLTKDKPKTAKSRRENLADALGMVVGLTMPAYILYDTFEKVDAEEARSLVEDMKEMVPPVDDLATTKSTALKILEESGLKSKGVEINFIDDSPESLNSLREAIFGSSSQNSFFGQRVKENYFNIFKEGANAGFFLDINKVFVSSNGMYDYVYHELGHAMNKNGNFITKSLLKMRNISPLGISLVAPLALAMGIFHKPDNDKPKSQKGFIEKSMDFVSKNPVMLTLASYIPMLSEEGLASIRGLKYASKHLEPQKIEKLAIKYTKAWGSYAGYSAAVCAGVWAGIKFSDYLKQDKQS